MSSYDPALVMSVPKSVNGESILVLKDSPHSRRSVWINKEEFRMLVNFVYNKLPEFTEGIL